MSGESLWEDKEDEVMETEEADGDEEESIEMERDETDVPVPDDRNSLIQPVEDIDEVVAVYKQFEEIKEKLLDTEEDITEISGNYHINKSGWRKIATAFNLSLEVINTESRVKAGIVKYFVTARAVAPNGKSTTGSGMCASNESNFMRKLVDDDASLERVQEEARDIENVLNVDGWYRELKYPREVNEHNVMATAETRAKNRAISDLVGGGEVSAEEMAAKKKEDILES